MEVGTQPTSSIKRQPRTHDPRIPVAKLRQPLGEHFVVRFFCQHCHTVLPVLEKNVMSIAGRMLASYEGFYLSVRKCEHCSGEGFSGAEFLPIPQIPAS